MTEDAKKPLGRILLRQRAITQPDLEKALESATPGGPPLASRLIESGAVSEIAALKALSEQSGVPGIDLNQVCVRLRDLEIVPREVAIRHKLLPILVRDDRVFVAMASPTEKKVIDEIEFVTGKRVFPYIALAGPLMRVISAAYEMRDRGEAFYVGPQCPPEIQRKAGYVRPGAAPEAAPYPTAEQARRARAAGRSAVEAAPAARCAPRPGAPSPAPAPQPTHAAEGPGARRERVPADFAPRPSRSRSTRGASRSPTRGSSRRTRARPCPAPSSSTTRWGG